MRTYRVTMASTRLSAKTTIDVHATSCIEAGSMARGLLGPNGYDLLVSILCIK